MDYAQILDGLTALYRDTLGANFVGIYVHGSLAMGCYNPKKSDIDYIIVCEEEPEDDIKRVLLEETLSYMPYAPAKGLEMHLLRRADCAPKTYPSHFCLHYSPVHTQAIHDDVFAYIHRMQGEDPDLAAHLTVINARGICWAGEPIAKVFGPVSREAYLESVIADADWDPEDCMYHALNNGRILAYLHEGSVLSKKEGGEWALENVDAKYAPVLREALRCYACDEQMAPSEEAKTFCTETLAEIKRLQKQ